MPCQEEEIKVEKQTLSEKEKKGAKKRTILQLVEFSPSLNWEPQGLRCLSRYPV